jgi:dihydrodipicolinate synthase/N-acetylneuraminate lyase
VIVLRGALAAAATPLREGGDRLDEAGFQHLTEFLVDAGLDGILALGTTGEGILLSVPERQRVAELFLAAAPPSFSVAVHCGAQTTADTVALASHAAESGAAAVAVIGPPYFQLDARSLLAHFVEAARAAAPTPFYAYELEKASGYAIPLDVIHALRNQASNFAGMKVSDAPWERFAPYLIEGLGIFVGPESLIDRGMAAGAVGAVSALATAFPEAVAEAVRTGDPARTAEVAELRATVERFPRHAALKHVLRARGVQIEEDVRRPLRGLTPEESMELDRLLVTLLDRRAAVQT